MKYFSHTFFVKHSQFLILLFGFLIVSITLIPLVQKEFFRVHDFTQGARIVEMSRGFQDGQIPVRWSKNFGYGYGMPTFLFYSPLPYIVGALFYWLSGSVIFAMRIIWAIPSILSFIGMYRLTKRHVGRLGALVAATAFTLAPYRAVDLYVRGALGEAWGIAFFPWILWSIDEWFVAKKKIDYRLVFFSLCLFLSHNLMALFFFPVILSYIFFLWVSQKNRKVIDLVWANVQILFAIGCSAFYLFPAFLEKNWTKFDDKILGGYFSYALHFLYIRQFFQENWKYGGSTWGPQDDISFFLGYGQLLGIILLGVAVVYLFFVLVRSNTFSLKKLRISSQSFTTDIALFVLSLIFLPVSLFLTLEKSKIIWDYLKILQTAQFPWRFLSLTILFLAVCVGFLFKIKLPQKLRFALAILLVVILVVPAFTYYKPEKYVVNSPSFYYDDAHRIRFEMSVTWSDFLPLHFNEKLPPTDTRYDIAGSTDPKNVEILTDRSQQLLLKTHFTQMTPLTIHIGDFPGWTTYIGTQKVDHQQTKDGLIELNVPPGEQSVGINLERTPIREISDLVTVITLCMLISTQIIVKRAL